MILRFSPILQLNSYENRVGSQPLILRTEFKSHYGDLTALMVLSHLVCQPHAKKSMHRFSLKWYPSNISNDRFHDVNRRAEQGGEHDLQVLVAYNSP